MPHRSTGEIRDRIRRAKVEADRLTGGQATVRDCDNCHGRRYSTHEDANSPTGEWRCEPCCACGGDGVFFQVRTASYVHYPWELLNEPRPPCTVENRR